MDSSFRGSELGRDDFMKGCPNKAMDKHPYHAWAPWGKIDTYYDRSCSWAEENLAVEEEVDLSLPPHLRALPTSPHISPHLIIFPTPHISSRASPRISPHFSTQPRISPRPSPYLPSSLPVSQVDLPLISGEWSLAMDTCAMWLLGFNDMQVMAS